MHLLGIKQRKQDRAGNELDKSQSRERTGKTQVWLDKNLGKVIECQKRNLMNNEGGQKMQSDKNRKKAAGEEYFFYNVYIKTT